MCFVAYYFVNKEITPIVVIAGENHLPQYYFLCVCLKRGMDNHNFKADCKVKKSPHLQFKTTVHFLKTLHVADCKLETIATCWLMIQDTDFYRMSLE
jgi:hypothetical protein